MTTQYADGALLPWEGATFAHQEALLNTAVLLRAACPPRLRVLAGPFPMRLGLDAQVSPDVLVVDYVHLISDGLTGVPVLVAEVVSPATVPVDRTVKKDLYARHGVGWYWIIDPDEPALTVNQLNPATGVYDQVAQVVGAETYRSDEPFAVTAVPLTFVAGLERP
jgi:Uma2 family endonuclease